MKISEVIKKLNDALEMYGDIPVIISLSIKFADIDIKAIKANDKCVMLCDFL